MSFPLLIVQYSLQDVQLEVCCQQKPQCFFGDLGKMPERPAVFGTLYLEVHGT